VGGTEGMDNKPCDLCKIRRATTVVKGYEVCKICFDNLTQAYSPFVSSGVQAIISHEAKYNEPEHYHKHDIDTIEFLQKGFPPEVFMGFAIGHIIKYAQRANYKNGREDFVKMVDYAKRALDWYDKTHS
jgi:hypothetical protein